MGLFSGGGILGDIGGALGINTEKQTTALREATEATTSSIDEAIAGLTGASGEARGLIEGATGEARGLLDPFARLAGANLPSLQQGATIGGFGQNISDILGGGALDPLIEQRQNAANSALGGAGLTRSSVAAKSAAQIPADLAFKIENLLNQRQSNLADTGIEATGNIANLLTGEAGNIGNIVLGTAQDVGNLRTQAGSARSQQILGNQQIKTSRNQNIIDFGINAVKTIAGLPSFSGGGGGGGVGGVLPQRPVPDKIFQQPLLT